MKLLGDKATAQFWLDLVHPQREQLKKETEWAFTPGGFEASTAGRLPIDYLLQDKIGAVLGLPEILLLPGERKVSAVQMTALDPLFRGSLPFVWVEQSGYVVIHDLFVGKDSQIAFENVGGKTVNVRTPGPIPAERFSILSTSNQMNMDTAQTGLSVKIDVENTSNKPTKVRVAIFGLAVEKEHPE